VASGSVHASLHSSAISLRRKRPRRVPLRRPALRSSGAPRIYSRADIIAASRARQKGQISERDYLRLSYDFVAAAREGRISDAPQLKGKGPHG